MRAKPAFLCVDAAGVLLAALFASLFVASFSVTAADWVNKIPDRARNALEEGEQFELFSLAPNFTRGEPDVAFHGYKILGSTEVRNAKMRKELVAALEKGVVENKGDAKKCFNPRHGIRVSYEGRTFDFLICFECLQVALIEKGKDHERQIFLITDSPQALFDKALTLAGVSLAEKPKGK